MDIVTRGPFRASWLAWQRRPGITTVTVVCKATFELAPERSPVAATQDDVHVHDVPDGAPERVALTHAADLVPTKKACEVLLTGYAHAPEGRRVSQLVARLAIGAIDKAIAVWGDRYFRQDGTATDPAPFARMPLLWERAAGGPDTSNPAGMLTGPEAKPDLWGRIALPNLLPVGTVLWSPQDTASPIGFGPLSPVWPSRRTRLHRHAATWDSARWYDQPLPADFDLGFWNAAPADQQCEQLTGEETIYLESLHPRAPQLSTRLDVVTPRAATSRGPHGREEVPLRLDTLTIDTERALATLLWRGHTVVDDPRAALSIVIEPASSRASAAVPATAPVASAPVASAPLRRATTQPLPGSHEPRPEDDPTLPPHVRARLAALSAVTQGASPGQTINAFGVTGPALPFPSADDGAVEEDDAPTAMKRSAAAAAPAPPPPDTTALPFRTEEGRVGASALGRSMRLGAPPSTRSPEPVSAPITAPAEPPPDSEPPPSVTRFAFEPPTAQALPFEPSGQSAPPLVMAPSAPPLAMAPSAPPAPVPSAPPETFETTAQALYAAAKKRAAEAPASPIEPAAPAPVFGPLATPESAPPATSESVRASADVAIAAKDAAPPPAESPSLPPTEPPPPPSEQKPLPLADYPLERCAKIDARIARQPARGAEILEENKLSPSIWERLHAHWQEQIGAESARGRHQRIAAYDQAYVAQIEADRGAISIDEYARWTVAADTGRLEAELEKATVPRAAWMRIQRIWIQRRARDVKLGKQLRAAIDAARDA